MLAGGQRWCVPSAGWSTAREEGGVLVGALQGKKVVCA